MELKRWTTERSPLGSPGLVVPVVLVGHLGCWCWVIAKLVGLGCFGESGFIGISTPEIGGGQEA